MTENHHDLVHIPNLPSYTEVRRLIAIWTGTTSQTAVRDMVSAVWDHTGTPQNQVDWSNPDEWIIQRLSGESAALAGRIWKESGETINPRYLYGAYRFIATYKLLMPDSSGVYRLSDIGQAFLDDDIATVRKIDEAEGIPILLSILAAHSPGKRGDLLEDWGSFLLAHSTYRTPSTIKHTLRYRMLNVVERGYSARAGNTYAITEKGIAYAADSSATPEQHPHQRVLSAIKNYNDDQVTALRERLAKMHPYRFEALIRDLLEAMDYEDVVVTKQSGDKGVDVIANYQFGITQIKEVVQVKRHQGSITRPVLDQLRGVLPLHQAIRGTIITTGRFARGCTDAALFPGAAPITLIDGDRLIDFLLKYEVGVKKRPQSLIEIDDSYFSEGNVGTEAEPALNSTEDMGP